MFYDQSRKKHRNKNVIDFTLLQELIETSSIYAMEIHDKIVMIVCGNTGSGKSTLITVLAGNGVEEIFYDGVKVLEAVGTPIVEIGHKNDSETLFLKALPLRDSSGLFLLDTPGFRENRGITEKICAAKNLKNAIEWSQKISGFMVNINYSDLISNKCRLFREFVSDFCEQFGSPRKLKITKTQIYFIVSHFPVNDPFENKDIFLAKIKRLKNELTRNETDQTIIEMLDLLEESNLFIFCVNAMGYIPGSCEMVTQEVFKNTLLSVIPRSGEIEKSLFALQSDESGLSKKIRECDAIIQLNLISGKNVSVDANVRSPFLNFYNAMKDIAGYYNKIIRNEMVEFPQTVDDFMPNELIDSIFTYSSFASVEEFEFFEASLLDLIKVSELIQTLFMDDEVQKVKSIYDTFFHFRNKLLGHVTINSMNQLDKVLLDLKSTLSDMLIRKKTINDEAETKNKSLSELQCAYEINVQRLTERYNNIQSEFDLNTIKIELSKNNYAQALATRGDFPKNVSEPGNEPEPFIEPRSFIPLVEPTSKFKILNTLVSFATNIGSVPTAVVGLASAATPVGLVFAGVDLGFTLWGCKSSFDHCIEVYQSIDKSKTFVEQRTKDDENWLNKYKAYQASLKAWEDSKSAYDAYVELCNAWMINDKFCQALAVKLDNLKDIQKTIQNRMSDLSLEISAIENDYKIKISEMSLVIKKLEISQINLDKIYENLIQTESVLNSLVTVTCRLKFITDFESELNRLKEEIFDINPDNQLIYDIANFLSMLKLEHAKLSSGLDTNFTEEHTRTYRC
ncbi:MAG: hypothetical protein AB7F64_06730 [Gammaproteobacteria bacterium]